MGNALCNIDTSARATNVSISPLQLLILPKPTSRSSW